MDQIVDVRALVDADRVAAGVDEEGERDRQIDLARIRLWSTLEPPDERHGDESACVAQGADPHRLAAVARRR